MATRKNDGSRSRRDFLRSSRLLSRSRKSTLIQRAISSGIRADLKAITGYRRLGGSTDSK